MSFSSTVASADSREIQDDPTFHQSLIRHRASEYPAGTLFPREHIDCPFYLNATVEQVIDDRDGQPKILFTSIPTNHADYYLFPNIVHFADGGDWVRTPLPNTGDGFVYVHESKNGKHLILTMENIPESPRWETRIVVSHDGGNTWSYGQSLKKYVYSHTIRYFSMNEIGEGMAVEYNDGDVGGYEELGYYIFKTDDWGRTWSERERQLSFDTAGFTDIFEINRRVRENRKPLRAFALPGLEDCSHDQ